MSVRALFKTLAIKVTGILPADTWTTKARFAGLVGNTKCLCHGNKHVRINTFFGSVRGTIL